MKVVLIVVATLALVFGENPGVRVRITKKATDKAIEVASPSPFL